MRVFVTGGAGFVGSHLLPRLMAAGVEVVVFDSLVTGARENVPTGVLLIEGDIRDLPALTKAVQGATHIVHLAALVSVGASMEDPLPTHTVNVTGMENVLCAARRAGVTRVVYASSASVYGDDPALPKTESSPCVPQSPYGLSKAVNELQAQMYERVFGLSTLGLRIFNVYGPGQQGSHPYASVIPRWVEAIKRGEDVMMNGDGSITRDFVHVRDVVGAIHAALTAEASGVVNIASGIETSLATLVELMSELVSFQVVRAPTRQGDVLHSVADISRAREVLGFKPRVALADGIKELVAS